MSQLTDRRLEAREDQAAVDQLKKSKGLARMPKQPKPSNTKCSFVSTLLQQAIKDLSEVPHGQQNGQGVSWCWAASAKKSCARRTAAT